MDVFYSNVSVNDCHIRYILGIYQPGVFLVGVVDCNLTVCQMLQTHNSAIYVVLTIHEILQAQHPAMLPTGRDIWRQYFTGQLHGLRTNREMLPSPQLSAMHPMRRELRHIRSRTGP